MLANGEQSIYAEFDVWKLYAKLEAEYNPGKYFELYHGKTMSALELKVFLSNYELWQYLNWHHKRFDALDALLREVDDED